MNPRPLPAIRPESSPSYLRRASPPPMPAAPEDESGPDWRRIWSALLRFKWVVLLMVLFGLGGALAAPAGHIHPHVGLRPEIGRSTRVAAKAPPSPTRTISSTTHLKRSSALQ